MALDFMKCHANGDDFVIVDLRGKTIEIETSVIARMGDRHRGVGFNQLVTISDCDDVDARLHFWNADGSILNACGSATRGVAWTLMQEGDLPSVTVRTNRGLPSCRKGRDGSISVAMGVPLLGWSEIPLSTAVDTLELPLAGRPSDCSMGNPHCTYFLDDLARVDVQARGREMENHPLFPMKTNVHFV